MNVWWVRRVGSYAAWSGLEATSCVTGTQQGNVMRIISFPQRPRLLLWTPAYHRRLHHLLVSIHCPWPYTTQSCHNRTDEKWRYGVCDKVRLLVQWWTEKNPRPLRRGSSRHSGRVWRRCPALKHYDDDGGLVTFPIYPFIQWLLTKVIHKEDSRFLN